MSNRKVEKAPIIEYEPFFTSYQGIEGIKPPGTKIEYTPGMIQEWIKCSEDPLYFISNYYYIVDLDKGLIPIKLWDFQGDFIDHIHNNRFSIVLASRQVGKSIISIGYILWYLIFYDYKYVAVLSKTAGAAAEIMGKLKRSFMEIPQWLQPNVTRWAGTTLQMDNGSFVSSQATTENAGRSASANILFLDEFAFVPTNIAQKFYTSAYPIITNSKESKVIICSTPNGHNHFYVMQDKAEKGENDYKKFTIMWDQVPGRDKKWKESTIKNLSMEDVIDGAAKFAQEYDLEFENTNARTLIGAAIQRKIANHISSNSFNCEIDALNDIDGLKIFEMVEPGKTYFLSADVAAGVGGDYSAFSILKFENSKYKQVARYKNNLINPIAYAEIINKFSKMFNNAYIMVENNNVGQSTVDHLWYNLESEYMIHTDKKMIGVKTHTKLRFKGISILKEYLEYGVLEINDIDSLQEISHFAQNSRGKFEAQTGFNDDIVMGLVIFSYISKDPEFANYLEINDNTDGIMNAMKKQIQDENPFLLNYNNVLGDENSIILVDNSSYFK